jgi:hypothetical protein
MPIRQWLTLYYDHRTFGSAAIIALGRYAKEIVAAAEKW